MPETDWNYNNNYIITIITIASYMKKQCQYTNHDLRSCYTKKKLNFCLPIRSKI